MKLLQKIKNLLSNNIEPITEIIEEPITILPDPKYSTEYNMVLEYLEVRPRFIDEIVDYMELNKIQCTDILNHLILDGKISKIGMGYAAIYQLV